MTWRWCGSNMVWPYAQPGCRCDDMDLVGMCCPAHSVCLPTSANACTARNTATLDVHCACASPTSLYRALRNSTMYEYSLPVGQHFTRGMNSTQRPAVLQGSHFPNAGQSRSSLCLLNIGLWPRYSEPRVCLAALFHKPHKIIVIRLLSTNFLSIRCHICLTRKLH